MIVYPVGVEIGGFGNRPPEPAHVLPLSCPAHGADGDTRLFSGELEAPPKEARALSTQVMNAAEASIGRLACLRRIYAPKLVYRRGVVINPHRVANPGGPTAVLLSGLKQ